MGNETIPLPLVVGTSGSWLGNDGSWSTFAVHVGTPPQNFSVLPATNGGNTWVPIADDCQRLNLTNCGASRGVLPFGNKQSLGFQTNQSSTWKLIGLYQLSQNRYLGFTGNGISGHDTVGYAVNSGSGTASLEHEVVTAYATPSYWLGQLGLSSRGMNFRQDEQPQAFLTNLRDSRIIPSISFGYTAGASYRLNKVPGSLVLGGYDQGRTSENLTVPISGDADRPLTVGLQKIVATNTPEGILSLMDSGILAAIDSSVPELWLPRSVCDRFESAFGLEYHEPSDRYALTDSTRDRLRQLAPTLTLTMGAGMSEGSTINIDMPYSAFDLQAGYPIFANSTNYFPIRRAANESQYVIGRVFLQEAYLSVDWERSYFNVSQTVFATPMPDPQIVTILSNNVTFNSTHSGGHAPVLSRGAIAGISIGAAVVLVALLVGVFLFVRRRRQPRPSYLEESAVPSGTSSKAGPAQYPTAPELMGTMIQPPASGKQPHIPEVAETLVQCTPGSVGYQPPELMGAMVGELSSPREEEAMEAMRRASVASEVEGSMPIYELRVEPGA